MTGTLHEAFITAGASGGAVGFVGGAGSLEPVSFTTADGTATEIQELKWRDGAVSLTLAPHDPLTGYVLDFFGVEGEVSLSLDAAFAASDSAAGTLSWPVSAAPWADGDYLMLRIRETGSQPILPPTATPVPTATPEPTLTPTPEPMQYTPPSVYCPGTGGIGDGEPENQGDGTAGPFINVSVGKAAMEQDGCRGVMLRVGSETAPDRLFNVRLQTTSHLAFDAECTGREKSWSELYGYTGYRWTTPLYACNPGEGTLTSVLEYAGGDGVERERDTVTIAGSTPAPEPTLEPTPTPEPLPCTDGMAVPNPEDHPGLVRDCQVLLSIRDSLIGPGGVDPEWSGGKPTEDWRSVRMSGTPLRVTSLALTYKGMDGSLPSGLGQLDALTRIDLRGNRLTGSIPPDWAAWPAWTSSTCREITSRGLYRPNWAASRRWKGSTWTATGSRAPSRRNWGSWANWNGCT